MIATTMKSWYPKNHLSIAKKRHMPTAIILVNITMRNTSDIVKKWNNRKTRIAHKFTRKKIMDRNFFLKWT